MKPPKQFDTKRPLFSEGVAKQRTSANRPKRYGMQPLSRPLESVTKPLLGKRGFVSGRILSHWGDIVGEYLAQQCTPDRIIFTRGTRMDGTLYIKAYGVQALELEYLKPQVIQQVNAHCGYRAVANIKITQTRPKTSIKPDPKPTIKPTKPLSTEQKATLDKTLATMTDSPLKSALKHLGRTVMGQDKHS